MFEFETTPPKSLTSIGNDTPGNGVICVYFVKAALIHCKKNHRFYGKIPGIWLPVFLPLFLRAFTCRTFF